MPFGTITAQSKNYEPRKPGYYVLSTVSFGSPTDEFRIRSSGTPDQNGILRSSITRVLEKDVTVGATTSRKAIVVTLNIASPVSGFTAAEADSLALDISEFVTAATVTRMLSGEV